MVPPQAGIVSRAVALVSIFALLVGTLSLGVSAKQVGATQRILLTEEQRILHVLNRLGFGARPGDIERVKAVGLDNYINQQLNPEKISDAVADAKVRNLATLNMTTAELYEKYPQPGQLLRQLQRRGDLPANLADARDNRVKGAANADANRSRNAGEMKMKPDAVDADKGPVKKEIDRAQADKANNGGDAGDNQKYRQMIRDYYLQNGLQLPQRIIAELQASRNSASGL